MENTEYEFEAPAKTDDELLSLLHRRVDRLTEFYKKNATDIILELELRLIKDTCDSLLKKLGKDF